jgi:hypothetical protein
MMMTWAMTTLATSPAASTAHCGTLVACDNSTNSNIKVSTNNYSSPTATPMVTAIHSYFIGGWHVSLRMCACRSINA